MRGLRVEVGLRGRRKMGMHSAGGWILRVLIVMDLVLVRVVDSLVWVGCVGLMLSHWLRFRGLQRCLFLHHSWLSRWASDHTRSGQEKVSVARRRE